MKQQNKILKDIVNRKTKLISWEVIKKKYKLNTVQIRSTTTNDADLIAPLFDAYRKFYKKKSDLKLAKRFISERLKKQEYTLDYSSNYFWRTHAQQEIDWVEEKDGQLKAFEFKWSKNARVKIPNAWKKGYPEATFESIDRSNYFDFITEEK